MSGAKGFCAILASILSYASPYWQSLGMKKANCLTDAIRWIKIGKT